MTTEFNFINEMPAQPEDEDIDGPLDDERCLCEVCGRDVNGYDSGGPCPACCSHSYAPGSEECDWCGHSDECGEHFAKL